MIRLSDIVSDKGIHGGKRDRFIAWVKRNYPDKILFNKLNGDGHKCWLAEEKVARQLYTKYIGVIIKQGRVVGAPVTKLPNKKDSISPHEKAAQAWEKEGYLVIRTYKRGCPDLIIVRPEDAPKIKLREIKGRGDKISKEQYFTQNEQQKQGFDSDFEWL